MKLIVGLGNPGKEYENTRHNLGFMVIDKIAEDLKIYDFKEKFKGLIGEGNYKGEKILLLKPQTFMNLSGDSIIQVLNFYKIDSEVEMIVIYDDMSLPIGKLRIREKGSAGGHNGIKSIISHVGEKFLRIKFGIGASGGKEKTVGFVLGRFSKEEELDVKEAIENASKMALSLLEGEKIEKIMQLYNKK
ncbi:aminoacyl-tRNA hydrolase [Fusobacterium sp.]|uniref:aminoacyl-tRNA hydrolase n=1 Tax=Fusobacterium sp. TaxID=68766 RepID=UPI00260EED36|nr:aminoacyl-tRNA hydrolase [Fusobacterium sp.]